MRILPSNGFLFSNIQLQPVCQVPRFDWLTTVTQSVSGESTLHQVMGLQFLKLDREFSCLLQPSPPQLFSAVAPLAITAPNRKRRSK